MAKAFFRPLVVIHLCFDTQRRMRLNGGGGGDLGVGLDRRTLGKYFCIEGLKIRLWTLGMCIDPKIAEETVRRFT